MQNAGIHYKPNDVTRHINRKGSYMVFLVINIAFALIRLGVFPGQTWIFHVSVFIGSLGFFILGWEFLIWMHRNCEKRLPIATKPVQRIVLQTLLTTVVFTVFSLLLFTSVSTYFHIEISPVLNKVIYLLNFLIAVIFNLILFGTHYFFRWKEDLVHKSNLEKEQAIVKYDALRNQLNPHFLFNVLTSLNSLIFENQQLASDFLQQLSKVYRYILQNKDRETVSLRTELEFIQHFIFLLKTRFGDAISFHIEVQEEDMDKGVVPVLTQMLIENVVKHNVISVSRPIRITIRSANDYLVVENNLIRKAQVESSNNLGLGNLRSLYKYLSDAPILVEESAEKFSVSVRLI